MVKVFEIAERNIKADDAKTKQTVHGMYLCNNYHS
jgi:hypothetical protein